MQTLTDLKKQKVITSIVLWGGFQHDYMEDRPELLRRPVHNEFFDVGCR